jgi:hypothetical protein
LFAVDCLFAFMNNENMKNNNNKISDTVLPSNWAMAEKWLGIREKESEGWAKYQAWYKQHLDFDCFEQDMDNLLAF